MTSAAPAPGGGWTVDRRRPATRTERVRPAGRGQRRVLRARRARATRARPSSPRPAARCSPGTELHDAEQARGKQVLVVGYGKSACDVTVPISEVAASTDVIARQLLWKVPRKIGGVLNFKMLLLTRMGEALFRYLRPRGVEKFLHGPGNGMRGNMINSIGSASVRQFGLKRLEPGAARADGGHRPRRDRPGHRGLLRGRRGRPHHRAPEPDHRPAAGRRTARPPPSSTTAPGCPPTSSSARPGSPRACRSCPPT